MYTIKRIGQYLDWSKPKTRRALTQWHGKLDDFKVGDLSDPYAEIILEEKDFNAFMAWLKIQKKFKYSTNNMFGIDSTKVWPKKYFQGFNGTDKSQNILKKYGTDFMMALGELDDVYIDEIINLIYDRVKNKAPSMRKLIVKSQKRFNIDHTYTNRSRKPRE